MENQLYAEERKSSILELVNEKKRMEVSELADLFKVTPSTIRNDLRELEGEGLVKRTHGGVIKKNYQRSLEVTPVERELTRQKYEIAEKALELIDDNDILAVDTGTTCMAFAEKLLESQFKNLTILTFDLEIGLLLSENKNFQVMVLGGMIRNGYPYVSGSSLTLRISSFSVDKSIIGTTGFDAIYGYSTPHFETAEIKKSLIDIGRVAIALCDSDKLNQRCFKQFADPGECEYLITDSLASSVEIQKLKRRHINVIKA
ncbi:MAG: DeoR/GlpR family DNA-binding transcription regulator [Streptococcaceae bacterium]|jgi:DeoR/GlpR family transcriptional regulator of sugar metabolism|nr:DeoR/GlpR family DNA-binding transcription regulator [Streptococcaceae bacterium]